MSGGYLFHPSSTEAFRERSNSAPVGIISHGWQCRRCSKRTTVVAGRKRNPHGTGWICVNCVLKEKE